MADDYIAQMAWPDDAPELPEFGPLLDTLVIPFAENLVRSTIRDLGIMLSRGDANDDGHRPLVVCAVGPEDHADPRLHCGKDESLLTIVLDFMSDEGMTEIEAIDHVCNELKREVARRAGS